MYPHLSSQLDTIQLGLYLQLLPLAITHISMPNACYSYHLTNFPLNFSFLLLKVSILEHLFCLLVKFSHYNMHNTLSSRIFHFPLSLSTSSNDMPLIILTLLFLSSSTSSMLHAAFPAFPTHARFRFPKEINLRLSASNLFPLVTSSSLIS